MTEKPFVVVAEDDPFYLKVYQTRLGKEGYDVALAKNGNEAITAARERKPDLMLLDLMMPEKDGFETLEEMHTDPVLKDVKVIILSNLSQEEDIVRLRALGAVDYVVKANVSFNEILEKIREHLK